MTQSAVSSAEHQPKSLATPRSRFRVWLIPRRLPLISTYKFWKTLTATVCPTNCPTTIRVKANWSKTWTTTLTVRSTRLKLELESTTVPATWAQTHSTQTLTTMASVTARMRSRLCALLVPTPTLSEPVRSAQLFLSTTLRQRRSTHQTQCRAQHGKFPLPCLLVSSLIQQPASSAEHQPKPWTTPRSPFGRTPLTQ